MPKEIWVNGVTEFDVSEGVVRTVLDTGKGPIVLRCSLSTSRRMLEQCQGSLESQTAGTGVVLPFRACPYEVRVCQIE